MLRNGWRVTEEGALWMGAQPLPGGGTSVVMAKVNRERPVEEMEPGLYMRLMVDCVPQTVLQLNPPGDEDTPEAFAETHPAMPCVHAAVEMIVKQRAAG